MAKVLIVYYSRTGNTKRMASFVADAATGAGADVSLQSVQDTSIDDLFTADAIVIGSPTYYGHSASQIRKLFDDSVKYHGRLVGKIGGAFASAHNIGGGNETAILDVITSMLVHGMIVQGSVDGDHYGPVSIGAPDRRAETQCRQLGERIVALANAMAGE